MGSEFSGILSRLNRPNYRLSKGMQQSVKSVHNFAFEVQAEVDLYVLLKRPNPVSLTLPAVCALPPYSVSDPMT